MNKIPFGPFPDFDACLAHMTKPKSEGGGGYDEETARKVCGKMQAELGESFSWAGSIKEMPGVDNLIRGKALHPLRTVHPEEWPEVREYLEEELEKSAHTLAGTPLILDHCQVLNGKVLGAEYEDGAIEYVAQLNDPRVMELVRNGAIEHCSVEFEWKSLDQVNGVAPRGINFTGLSLLRLFEPGDPLTTVEVWEGIIKQMKEAKMKEQAEPQEFILYVLHDPVAFLPEHFSTAWIDQTNGIQGIFGRLRENPESSVPQALLFMKANSWNLEKMQDWLQNHPQYLRASAPPQPGIQPSSGDTGVTATEQQGDQEPEKDEHGCIIGKERYDETQDKCVPIETATEQQPEELEKKVLGEAIIASETPHEPSDLISKREILALIPEPRIWRSWSYGPQRLIMDLKRKLEHGED